MAAAQFLGLLKSRGFYPYFFSGNAVGREEMGTIISETVELLLRAYGPQSGTGT
ncbi:TetR/AcrR family transcriptional regulator C-terminal domain-containing protein [Pannonibacter phragmitetus]|uniref:TetR/AcrR family transcriptional regulator C-terminal domain-containing protein n=1 Tax=Pannonibacter phragmitetus TaxID=121719 RepID=UPI003D2ED360